MQIEPIAIEQTYSLRHRILRAGRPIENCYFAGDKDPESVHLGVFMVGTLVGILSALPNPYPENQKAAYQIRGMAVAEEARKKGVATALLKSFESYAQQQTARSCIWLNARIGIQDLYLKNGFSPQGSPFLIEEIGIHQRFFKSLGHESS